MYTICITGERKTTQILVGNCNGVDATAIQIRKELKYHIQYMSRNGIYMDVRQGQKETNK